MALAFQIAQHDGQAILLRQAAQPRSSNASISGPRSGLAGSPSGIDSTCFSRAIRLARVDLALSAWCGGRRRIASWRAPLVGRSNRLFSPTPETSPGRPPRRRGDSRESADRRQKPDPPCLRTRLSKTLASHFSTNWSSSSRSVISVSFRDQLGRCQRNASTTKDYCLPKSGSLQNSRAVFEISTNSSRIGHAAHAEPLFAADRAPPKAASTLCPTALRKVIRSAFAVRGAIGRSATSRLRWDRLEESGRMPPSSPRIESRSRSVLQHL